MMTPAGILLILSSITLCNSEIGAQDARNPPTCIIGGGVGGLTLANRLQAKGHRVYLFEKTGRFGGKMDTFKDEKEGLVLEMGPMFLSSAKTSYINIYAKKHNMTIIPYNITDQAMFDTGTGRIFGSYNVTPGSSAKLLENAKKYATVYNHSELYEVGYPNIDPSTSDYGKPFSAWLEDRGLSPLAPIFYFMLTLFGYGDLREVPALYALKYIAPEVLLDMFESRAYIATVAEGWGVLAERMAVPVIHKFPKHEVIKILRHGNVQEVTFLVDGKTESIHTCANTIITFIPLLSNIQPVVRDLTSEEKSVLEMVKVNRYASSGHTISTLKHFIYMGYKPKLVATPLGENILPEVEYPKGHGEVILFGKAGKGENPHGYIAYSWLAGDYDSEATIREEEIMKRKLNGILNNIDPSTKAHFFKSYQYFPHVTGSSIRKGFYHKLEAMQGNGGLYYACPILTFDDMNFAIEMGEKFADKFF